MCFFLGKKNADVFFDRIKKRACVSHLKLKTRMCFWTEEKNADVFFFVEEKTRMCFLIG